MNAARILPVIALLPVLLAFFVRVAESQTLRGSRASVDRIHRQAVTSGLHFYESPAGVRKAAAEGRLVRLRGNRNYQLAGVAYPYVLPITEVFIERLAQQYRSACGERLVVTSAMRPRSFRLVNSSHKSVHPTGMAIDLRRPANPRCLAWLRRTLLSLEGTGVLEAVEERNPPHFHVALFPNSYHRYVQRQGGDRRLTSLASATPPRQSGSAAGPTYRVRRGDSLWGIARRHGSTVEEIKRLNGMRSTRILVGQELVIPTAR